MSKLTRLEWDTLPKEEKSLRIHELSANSQIDLQLKDRIEDLEKFINRDPIELDDEETIECFLCGEEFDNTEDYYEHLSEEAMDYGLCYDDDIEYRAKRFELSTGGPADGFYYFMNEGDHEPWKVVYYFINWFDPAERKLYGEDERIAMEFWHMFLNF